MSDDISDTLLKRLKEHLNSFSLPRFEILFHGGEPLLFPKRKFFKLCEALMNTGAECGSEISFSITTNGTLVDEEWCALFRALNVAVTVSYDGPTHDKHRVTRAGAGTALSTLRGINHLRKFGVKFGCLSVCDTNSDPVNYYRHMNEIGIKHYDVLLPDVSWTNGDFKSVAPFMIGLFDYWFENSDVDGVSIRTFSAIIRGLLGLDTGVESYGYGPITTTTLLVSGDLEPLDVLRANGGGFTKSSTNIVAQPLQSIKSDQKWLEIAYQSTDLCDKCKACRYSKSCGGGFFPHRWSGTSFKKESRYCADIQKIYDHIWDKLDNVYAFSESAG